MVKVIFSSVLRSLVEEEERIVNASTVQEALEELIRIYDGKFKEKLFNSANKPKKFINIYVNNKDIRFLKGLKTELKEEDELLILPAVSGG
jgi:molybdopterin synthase sulfur carrier subunit